HRTQIKYRTIVWGVGLQLLFATIILGGEVSFAGMQFNISFPGMFLFAFLINLYLFEEELAQRQLSKWTLGAGVLIGSAVLVLVLYQLAASGVTFVLLVLAALTAAVAAKLGKEHLGRLAVSAILLLGLSELWFRQIDGRAVFKTLSDGVASFLGLSNEGAWFLFRTLVQDANIPPKGDFPGFGFQFAFSVLPTIIFFSAFISVLYYLGIVQAVISTIAKFMHWSMKTSGSETTSCSGNIFVGQTESPFLIKPFLKDMTVSELHAVMVGGFATVAGGVLAAYIGMGVNAGHLIAASVMSAPAALVMAKLLYPETEHSVTAGDVEIPKIETADNVIEAAANGTTDGLKLALNVGAMLIAFIALIAVLDTLLGFCDGIIDGRLLASILPDNWAQTLGVGETTEFVKASGKVIEEHSGIFPGSMRTLFGTLLAPLAFIMGVPWADAGAVGNLLGIKLTINEFVAYGRLSQHIDVADIGPRSQIIATYALCGFANFSSIGIQIGGIGSLAPERRAELAKVGLRAMCAGALASFMTATIAGILL
ncbi:MAG: nucleoside transporter C-terminal domain-containing protein, partial [Thermoanaerobaculia bacterium]